MSLEPGHEPVHHGAVHIAYDIAKVPGKSVERAVPKRELAIGDGGLIAVALQDAAGTLHLATSTRPLTGKLSRSRAERLAECAGMLGERRSRVIARQGPREQMSCHVVAPWRQADLDLASGAAVQLGRASGTWPLLAGQPAERDVQQPLVSEPVEVERRHIFTHPDSHGSLVPTHGTRLARHVLVQSTTNWVIQRGDSRHVGAEGRRLGSTAFGHAGNDIRCPIRTASHAECPASRCRAASRGTRSEQTEWPGAVHRDRMRGALKVTGLL
jgi:hypothetical protein